MEPTEYQSIKSLKKGVVGFKDLALQYFDEITEIQEYINASMTRYILVLENKK